MPHVGTHLAPLGVDVAIGKLNQVQGILNIGTKIFQGYVYARLGGVGVLELAAQSARDDGQRFGTDVLGQLEELEESQSVRLVVVGEVAVVEGVLPAVMVQRTVLNGADTVLPLVALVQRATLYDATAGEAEHARVQVFQGLCQVASHAVLAVLVGIDGE